MNVPTPGLTCPTCSASVASVDLTITDPVPAVFTGAVIGSLSTQPSEVSRRVCVPCGHELAKLGQTFIDGVPSWDVSPS